MTAREARLRRRKARLTRRCTRRDLKHQGRRGITNDSPPRTILRYQPRNRTLLRAKLYRTDLLLDQLGAFGSGSSLWTDDGWLIGAVRMPGRNTDYRTGRVLLDALIVHYTVGNDSRGPGLRGLFQFLIAKDGTIYQFAQALSVCAHACEFNHRSVGVETEKLRNPEVEPSTDAQLVAYGRILAGYWQKGLPRTYAERYHNGVRDTRHTQAVLPAPLLSHRTLDIRACDFHVDYLPEAEIARVIAEAEAILGGGGSTTDDRRRKVAALR